VTTQNLIVLLASVARLCHLDEIISVLLGLIDLGILLPASAQCVLGRLPARFVVPARILPGARWAHVSSMNLCMIVADEASHSHHLDKPNRSNKYTLWLESRVADQRLSPSFLPRLVARLLSISDLLVEDADIPSPGHAWLRLRNPAGYAHLEVRGHSVLRISLPTADARLVQHWDSTAGSVAALDGVVLRSCLDRHVSIATDDLVGMAAQAEESQELRPIQEAAETKQVAVTQRAITETKQVAVTQRAGAETKQVPVTQGAGEIKGRSVALLELPFAPDFAPITDAVVASMRLDGWFVSGSFFFWHAIGSRVRCAPEEASTESVNRHLCQLDLVTDAINSLIKARCPMHVPVRCFS